MSAIDNKRNCIPFFIKLDFMGKLLYQIDAAPRCLMEVRFLGRIHQLGLIETIPLVLHGDSDSFPIAVCDNSNVFLFDIPIPVGDGVNQRFIHRQPKTKTRVAVVSQTSGLFDYFALDWIDVFDSAFNPKLNLHRHNDCTG